MWKVFVKESSRRISEDTQKISAENLRDRNFKGEDRNGTDKSDLNSLKYHRVKHRDEDAKFVFVSSQLCLD